MRRRLPLMDAVSPPPPLAPTAPRIAAPWAVGIADCAESEDSFAFASELASELRRADVPVRLALLAYELPAAVPSRARAASGAQPREHAISCHAVSAQGGMLPALDQAEGVVTLLVGSPALGSFSPGFSILLSSERAGASTPAFLRALRSSVHLALPTPRMGLATHLGQRMLACGFLPRA